MPAACDLVSPAAADPDAAEHFYDGRYETDYMRDWPAWKKRRIRDAVRALGLPRTGRALDFGCGQGVFTQVVKEALPGWEVSGCDISQVAIRLASRRFPACRFFSPGDAELRGERFDLILSHHVLEHVADLGRSFAAMADHAAASARMFHVLPCGNPGSLEHRVATLRADGIDAVRGNRFFFEDEGHLRRLTTSEMEAHLSPLGFRLSDARYANQYHGAIDWITSCGVDFAADFADPTRAADATGAAELARLHTRLLRLSRLRAGRGLRRPIARAVDRYCRVRAEREWRLHSREPGGSEMVLTFERNAT